MRTQPMELAYPWRRYPAAVQVDVAAHGIDAAQPVEARLAAREPEDARQYPVALGIRRQQFGRPGFAGRAPPHEYRVLGRAGADLGADQVAAARRHETALPLAGPVLRRRHRITAQQQAVVAVKLQRLGGNTDPDMHQASAVFARRAAKKPDSSAPHSPASTPSVTSAW
jgi:hypothetical protein